MRRNLFRLVCFIGLCTFIVSGWFLLLIHQGHKQDLPVTLGQDKLIRLHVLANSDSQEDQQLKLQVRDAVIQYLAPYLEQASSVEAARQIVSEHQGKLAEVAEGIVAKNGAKYPVNVQIGIFDFPIKSYGNLVLPAGKYEAVRILIGKAEGKNWWCVLFPPLCFIDVTNATAVPAIGTSGMKEENQQSSNINFKWKVAELLTDEKITFWR